MRAFYASVIAIAVLWALPRNAHAQLYVAQISLNIVSEYDAKTGAAISPNFITGLNGPTGIAVKGNILFVSNQNAGTIGEYDAKTGPAINPNFIGSVKNGAKIREV